MSITLHLDQIEQALAPYLNGAKPILTPIPTGKFNTSFYVQAGSTDWVVRVAPHSTSTFVFYERAMMKQEPHIHDRLLRETSVPVAPVIVFDEKHEVVDHDFIILERLPGHPLSDHESGKGADILFHVGRALAQTHRVTETSYGYLGEHEPLPPQATWPEAFRHMWMRLITDVEASGHYNRKEARTLNELLEQNIERFDRDVPSSLLHMDVWAQNILVDDQGSLTGLIDWDRALWGDPEIEFAVLDYCGISHPPLLGGIRRGPGHVA